MSTTTFDPGTVPAIRATEIDGVRVLWAPGPPPLRASLVFRVGRSDETLVTGGVTHLVEHLSLFGLGRQCYGYNGFVEPSRTAFVVAGEEAEVVDYLSAVTMGLWCLPLDRFEAEARVLRTEAAGRGRGWVDSLLAYRYGPQGYGLSAYQEYGLERLTARDVEDWAGRYFTSGNAVLWLSGPPPAGLRLNLAEGDHHEPVEPQPVPFSAPAWLHERTVGVAVSIEGRRSVALSAALRVAQARMESKLRRQLGVSYHVSCSYLPLTGELAHATIAADGLPEHADEVKDGMLAVLDELAEVGPTAAELRDDIEMMRRATSDPASVLGALDQRATQELLLGPVVTSAEVLAELEDMDPSDIAYALDTALQTALLVIPSGTGDPGGPFQPYPMWSPERVRGWASAPTGDSWNRLVASPEGASLVIDDDRAVTVRFDRCVAALRWDDGSRGLWGDDGFYLQLRPWEWTGGDEIIRTVDTHVPEDLWVPMGEGSGPPPEEPPAESASPPATAPPAATAPPPATSAPPPASAPLATSAPRPVVPNVGFVLSVIAVAFLWLCAVTSVGPIVSPAPDEDRVGNAMVFLFFAGAAAAWTRSIVRSRRRGPALPA